MLFGLVKRWLHLQAPAEQSLVLVAEQLLPVVSYLSGVACHGSAHCLLACPLEVGL